MQEEDYSDTDENEEEDEDDEDNESNYFNKSATDSKRLVSKPGSRKHLISASGKEPS